MLDINPLLTAVDGTPTMGVAPPVRHSRLHTILHPTYVRPAMLRLALPPHTAALGLARMIRAKVSATSDFATMAPGLEADMLAAELVAALGALLVALVRRRAVVRAAPPGGHHVVARVAAACAARHGARAVQLAKVRGVRLGVAGAGDLGGAAGREARVPLAVQRARVDLLGLVAGGVGAAVGHAVWVAGIVAPRCAGGGGTAV